MIHIQPKIIGLSGISGAGKTTLTRSLSEYLNATEVVWDDFDAISQAPDDYVDWYYRGENYSEFKYPSLEAILRDLKSKKSPCHPVFQTPLPLTKIVIFDAPLGYLHQQTGQYIDICIHIEVPLDVSLGRRLLRDFQSPDKTKEDLLKEVTFYLSSSRPLFFDTALKATADFIIDGIQTTEKQIEIIKNLLSI